MARIADSTLEDIRQRVDIVELVREYLPNLKRGGRSWKACCPFHQEKTPSFTVNPERQIFHCFGCQAGGDVFSFVMKMENLEFMEAVEKLAGRAGVRLAVEAREEGPRQKERRLLLSAVEFARGFYHDFLMREAEAAAARRYLAGRSVKADTVRAFKLGYAPRGAEALLKAAGRKGFDAPLLVKAGLAARREDGTHRDYFWARILYPIQNARGETAGFGARVLGDGEPKYLNSPETPLFSKGRILYGFFEGISRIRKERRAALMEGYMDVLAAHQVGFTHACAPLGTALSEDHAALIRRYAEDAVILFDPDAAGAAASLRGAEILLERGVKVRVATVPGGLDPDELLMKSGPRALAKCLEEAEDLAEFRTALSLKGRSGAFLEPEEKSRVAAEVLRTIRLCSDEVLKREWVRRLAERLSTDEESLLLELRRSEQRPRGRPVPAPAGTGPSAKPLPAAEEYVLFCLLKDPSLALSDELVAESDFSDPRARGVFAGMRRAYGGAAGPAAPERVLDALEGEERSLVSALLVDERTIADPRSELTLKVGRLRKERRLREIEPLVMNMRLAEASAEGVELYEECVRLRGELQGSKGERE
ncbi:MAG: DNA primase [Elusimicrobia bacterium]|nr:DNA primase [Elusimicrobiota bacterium]